MVGIIEGGLKPDPYRVSSFAVHLAQRLEDDGESRLGQRIRQLTDRASKPAGSTFVSQGLPADLETQQFLVEQVTAVQVPRYPELPAPIDLELRRFVELNRRSGELASAGIEAPSSLLLFGPPGCGKTMAASALASDLSLPLFLVRLDALIGSYLGNSAKNLRRVFDNAIKTPCVLFLDEFDAIGKVRDDAQEVGEIKRLVGSLLQNLDRVRGGQILVAATNHHHILDPAIWRRFDVALELSKPGKSELSRIVLNLDSNRRLAKTEVEAVAILAEGLSGSDITSVIRRAYQDEFLNPQIPLQRHITLGVVARLKGHEVSFHRKSNKKDLIRIIVQLECHGLAARHIAGLVGCESVYVHQVAKSIQGWKK